MRKRMIQLSFVPHYFVRDKLTGALLAVCDSFGDADRLCRSSHWSGRIPELQPFPPLYSETPKSQ